MQFFWVFFVCVCVCLFINQCHPYRLVVVVSWLNDFTLAIDLRGSSVQHQVKHAIDMLLDSSTMLHPMVSISLYLCGLYNTQRLLIGDKLGQDMWVVIEAEKKKESPLLLFYIYIYIYIYICANFIKHNRHFMPTYFLLDPFEFPYYFYHIRGKLI